MKNIKAEIKKYGKCLWLEINGKHDEMYPNATPRVDLIVKEFSALIHSQIQQREKLSKAKICPNCGHDYKIK